MNEKNATPLTFREWSLRNPNIAQDKTFSEYDAYVKKFLGDSSDTEQKKITREEYINLLKQLSRIFKSQGIDDIGSIDFNDDTDLEYSLPLFTSKLKDIALYIMGKREAIKRAKTKYSMTGSYAAIEKIFYEYLLKAFTKKEYTNTEHLTNTTDITLLSSIPELSAINKDFQITVNELYDDSTYFDRDPRLLPTDYFDFDADVYDFLTSMNISSSYCDWLYKLGSSPLITGGDNSSGDYENKIKLANKYMGEVQYMFSGGYWEKWEKEIEFDISEGNNRFYWVTGKNILENDTTFALDPIPISSTPLKDLGTAGKTYNEADICFAVRDDDVRGAWLRLVSDFNFNTNMIARLDRGKTIFSYPYPGYGLSGEYLPWSGRLLSNLDRTYFYLKEEEQKNIYNAYWNYTETKEVSTFNDLYINDTSLIDSGAKAGFFFNEADYIVLRDSNNINDPIYKNKQEFAWLYKIINTDIPIAIGENKIYWPFERYIENISMNPSVGQCEDIILSGLSMKYFKGSIASETPANADKIFKKDSPNSENFIEGAWLSGGILNRPHNISPVFGVANGSYQPGISLKTYGGMQSTFIWTDDNALADDVFFNLKHQDDCGYLKEDKFSLFNERPHQNRDFYYNAWGECTCRSILYSPLGHPGAEFDDYGGMADYIVAINSPSAYFNFKDWVGSDGKNYKQSKDFGWFRLDGQYSIEPDVGWGSGKWVSNNGQPYVLSSNNMYAYFRNSMHRDDASTNVPYLITRKHNTISRNAWMKMAFDKDSNEWISANVVTDMVIKPGDILQYNHADTLTLVLTTTSIQLEQREIPTFPNLDDFSVTIKLNPDSLPTSSISVPIQAIDPDSTSSNLLLSTIDTIETEYFGMPPSSGFTINGSVFNFPTATNTTALTTISTIVTDYFDYTNEPVNFVLNVHLYGWNYDNSVYDGISLGAKPVWVVASDEEDEHTKQKGIDAWAGSPILVDDYNFISQPTYSNMRLFKNSYIEYNRRDPQYFVWNQPITVKVEREERQWSKLLIDKNKVSNLSTVLDGNVKDIIISATEIPSDIVFETKQDHPLYINYFARNEFIWNQKIYNSSMGIPPTGGLWMPISTTKITEPDAPHAHLSNRHFPTFASIPFTGDLYSVKDSGGYMIPKNLGVSVAISKNNENIIDINKLKTSSQDIPTVYKNIDIYTSDRGLSKNDQLSPIINISTDSSWMKSDITEGLKRGMIKNSRRYQKFTPYQTQYEIGNKNAVGIVNQNMDYYSPWDGEAVWRDDINYPPDWKGVYDIEEWYAQNQPTNLSVYNWKTDIYGNQYILLKDIPNNTSIYDKKHNIPGILKIKNSNSGVSVPLDGIYEHIPTSLSFDNNTPIILDIDVWYDTLMIYTSSSLLFFRVNMDYETGIPYSNPGDINYIITENSIYGNTWFFEKEKNVTICTLLSCGDHIRPVLRNLDLNNNTMHYLFNLSSVHTNASAWGVKTIDHPTLTYDKKEKIYDVSFIMYTNSMSGMYFASFYVKDYTDYYDIIDSRIITPMA